MSGLRGRARLAIDKALTGAGSALDRGVMRVIQRAMNERRPTRSVRDPRARLLALADHYAAAVDSFYVQPPAVDIAHRPVAPRAGAAEVIDLAWPSLYRPSWPDY